MAAKYGPGLGWIPVYGNFGTTEKLPSMVKLSTNIYEKIRWPGGKYVIRFNQLGYSSEIIQWIKDNIPNTCMTKDPTKLDLVRFKSKEDLMAFKLRW